MAAYLNEPCISGGLPGNIGGLPFDEGVPASDGDNMAGSK